MSAQLKDEEVPFRHHAFNLLLVLVMKVSFLTYFVLSPWLDNIASTMSVSLTTTTLIAVVYEVGKFIGCIIYGRLGDTKNTLTCTLASMCMFVILACVLTAYLAFGWRTHTPFDFVIFSLLYLPLSVLCIAPQFGLAILKKTNSAARCKRYTLLQGLFACILQGAAVPFGEAAGNALGWELEFLFLAGFVGIVAVGAFFSATPLHFQACRPPSQSSSQGLLENPQLSYWGQVMDLLLNANHRTFQVFILTLGVATACMYMLPMYGMILLQTSVSKSTAANIVGATFIANLFSRVLGLCLASRFSSVGLVLLGLPFLVMGSVIAMVVAFVPTLMDEYFAQCFLIVGLVLQIGIGWVMPNCKAGALLAVPDETAAAANSIVKLSQLVFTALAQIVATLMDCPHHFSRFALLLMVLNLPCAISLFSWYIRAQREVREAENEPEPSEEYAFPDVLPALPTNSWANSFTPLSGRVSFGATLPVSDLLVHVRRCKDIGDESLPAHDKFLETFNKYGICVIQCAEFPPDTLELKPLFGETVPHELADSEGRVIIDPSAERASKNVKATETEHQLHTDESYSNRPGRILSLACEIASATGGESVVVSVKNMFQVAAKELNRNALHALFSNDALTINRTLPGSDQCAEAKIAIFNKLTDGRAGARWRSRDSYLQNILEEARPGFEFLEKFVESDANRLLVKLAPGQVLIMDNTAVLHGRLPFPQGERRRMVRVNFFNNGSLRARLVEGFSWQPRSLTGSLTGQVRSLTGSLTRSLTMQPRSLTSQPRSLTSQSSSRRNSFTEPRNITSPNHGLGSDLGEVGFP